MSFIVSPRAETDIQEIIDYIAQDSPAAAIRVLNELEAAMDLLASFPGIGHPRADVRNPDYRFWNVFNYVVAYRTLKREVTIVRVVHGHRDISNLLSD
jgi:toxin ParE1/3/4